MLVLTHVAIKIFLEYPLKTILGEEVPTFIHNWKSHIWSNQVNDVDLV